MVTDYPIKNKDFDHLCSDWDDDLVLPYDVKLGKKCYLQEGNSLVAILPKALCFGQNKSRTPNAANSWYLSYISAKDGKSYYVPLSQFLQLYETHDDFVHGRLMPKSTMTTQSCISGQSSIDGFTFEKVRWRTHIRGFGYDSGTGNTFTGKVPFRLWVDADGTHFEADLTVQRNGMVCRLYPTSAEAMCAGRSKSEVIDFSDGSESECKLPEVAMVSWRNRSVVVALDELGVIIDRLK